VIWAIEDCRHVSQRLEQALLAAGQHVLRVPPVMTARARVGEPQRGKSDPIDALAVARAVVREGVDRFPTAFLDPDAMEIRLLHDHREQLVAERTRMQNRLRFHLVTLDPRLEAELAPRTLDQTRTQTKIQRQLTNLPRTAEVRVALSELAHIRRLTTEINELLADLDRLTSEHNPALREETGCGPVTAAVLIGQTAGAQRFATDAKFARLTGTAPIPASSGNTSRYRLNRGGNRQLNKALHMIAVTKARIDPDTRAYLQRKREEGKSNKEALRCLKRHLARRIWRLLYNRPPATEIAARPVTIQVAPGMMPCIG
jgi:transposase